MAGVDLFAALGVDPATIAPPPQPPTGVDLFKALGVQRPLQSNPAPTRDKDAWFDALPRDPPPSGQMIQRPSGGESDTSWFDRLPRDPPPTSILDSLTPVSPTDGMVAAGMGKTARSNPGAIPTMRVRPDDQAPTSTLDSLLPVKPTPAMLLAQGKQPEGEPQSGGIARNVAAGAIDAGANFGNVLADPIGNLIGRPLAVAGVFAHDALAPYLGYERFDDATRNMLLGQQTPQLGDIATAAVGRALNAPSPDSVPANSIGERLTRKAVSAAGAAASLSPSGALLPGVVGAGGAVVGDVASQAAPDWAKPAVELGGNVVGSGLTAAGARGTQVGGGLIARKAGEMGIGSRQDFGDVRATGSQINAAGQQVSKALGPQGGEIIERATDAEQAARAAEAKLNDPNLHPTDRADIEAQLADLQSRRVNIVPGSQPTTAQLAPKTGAPDLEKAARVADPQPFIQRAQEQNNAQVATINAVQPEGEPLSLGRFFTNQLDQLQQQGNQAMGAARSALQAQADRLGGQRPLGDYGAQIRDTLLAARDPVRAATGRAWAAVDPDNNWALSSGPLRDAGKALASFVSPTAQTDPQTTALIDRARSLPGVVGFQNLSQMRADANAAMARLSGAPGYAPEVRRLSIFKGALDDSIAKAIDDRAQVDPSITQRVQQVMPGAASAAAAAPRAPESAGAPPQPLQPNLTQANVDQYRAAVAATRNEKQQFNQGGVGQVLRPGSNFQDWRVPDGRVAGQIFTGGPTEPAEVARFLNAVGGPEQAADVGRNVLAHDLRTKGVMNPDGTLDADRFARWQAQRAPTLGQFPGLVGQFRDLESAQRALDDVSGQHVEAVRDYNHSAAGSFIGADPLVAVRRAFASSNPTETFTGLARAVRGHPEAEAGLRRAVVDHILERFSSAKPSADGIDMLKAAGFRSWVAQHKGPIRALFGGQGIQNLEMVAADLRRQAERPAAVAGSQTAVHGARAGRTGVGAVAGHGGTAIWALLGEHAAEHLGGHGLIGAGVAFGGAQIVHALRQASIRTRTELVREMMLNPELARAGLERVKGRQGLNLIQQRRFGAALQGAIAGHFAAAGQQRQ